jgi:hypothetical protein
MTRRPSDAARRLRLVADELGFAQLALRLGEPILGLYRPRSPLLLRAWVDGAELPPPEWRAFLEAALEIPAAAWLVPALTVAPQSDAGASSSTATAGTDAELGDVLGTYRDDVLDALEALRDYPDAARAMLARLEARIRSRAS